MQAVLIKLGGSIEASTKKQGRRGGGKKGGKGGYPHSGSSGTVKNIPRRPFCERVPKVTETNSEANHS